MRYTVGRYAEIVFGCSREKREEYYKDNMDAWCGKLGTREFFGENDMALFPWKAFFAV